MLWYVLERLLEKNHRLEVSRMVGQWFYNLLSGSKALEKSHKIQTTLVDDLYEIADEIGKDFKDHDVYDINVWEFLQEVQFKTRGYSEKQVRKSIGLYSLEIRRKWPDGEIWWEADLYEFEEKYSNLKTEYGKYVRGLGDFVKENYNNTAYHYIFSRYEDSVNIVLNTIKEDKQENNGIISDDVLEKSKLIINKLNIAIDKKKVEVKKIQILQDKAAQKSRIGRLDSELEFIDKFIEV